MKQASKVEFFNRPQYTDLNEANTVLYSDPIRYTTLTNEAHGEDSIYVQTEVLKLNQTPSP
jgi:hypothetical protein